MASFLEELRQRRVVRALLAYGAGVAAVLQGTDMVFAALALPDFGYRIIVIAALAGFPLVATLSWVFDLTAFAGVGAAAVAFTVLRMRGTAAVPVRDPYLEDSLRYLPQ